MYFLLHIVLSANLCVFNFCELYLYFISISLINNKYILINPSTYCKIDTYNMFYKFINSKSIYYIYTYDRYTYH